MLPADDQKDEAGEGRALLLPLLLLLLGLAVLLGLRAWRDYEPVGQREPRKPCDPPSTTGLPNAPGVAGLYPAVLVFSPDCLRLVSGNRNGSLQAFDADDGSLLATAPAHADRVRELLVTTDGRFLFSSSQSDPVVLAWSLPELRPAGRFDTGKDGASAIAWSEARKLLFTAGTRMRAWHFDPATGAKPSETAPPLFTASSPNQRFEVIAVSPDGMHVATASTTRLQLWWIQSRERPGLTPVAAIAHEPKDSVVALSFSVDGKFLASMRRSKKLELWQVPGLTPHPQAAASPPAWEFYTDPWKLTLRPPRAYAGADKAQLVIKLDDYSADRMFNEVVGKPNEPRTVRGNMIAVGNAGGLSVFDFYATPTFVKIVSVPAGYGGR